MMRSRIEIELVGGKSSRSDVSAFTVAFTAGNPRVAQKVTTQLTSLFIEENLKVREQQSEGTTSFLEAQVEKARTNLQMQEERMREFKSRNLGSLPEQQSGNQLEPRQRKGHERNHVRAEHLVAADGRYKALTLSRLSRHRPRSLALQLAGQFASIPMPRRY